MKPHERRAEGAYPYYKLAVWNERNHCWNDGKRAYRTADDAWADAGKPGRYRLSEITAAGRNDLEPFTKTERD